MRKFLLLTFIFSSVISYGQDLKNDSEWAIVVDYVCSRYVQSFCDQRCKEGLSNREIDKYNDIIKPELEGKKVGEAPSRQSLQDLLTNNGFNRAFKIVVKPLQNKYDIDASSRTLANALDLSILDEEVRKYLVNTKNSLDKELRDRYSSVQPKEVAQTTVSQSKIEDSQRQNSVPIGWILLSLLELLLIIGLLFFLLHLTSDKRIKRIVYNSRSLESKFVQKADLDYMPNRQEVKRRFDMIEEDIKKLKESSTKQHSFEYREHELVEEDNSVQSAYAPVFAKNFREGLLRVVDITEAQYKLELVNETSAKFYFCGDVSKAKANSDGTFDYVCEWEGVVTDANSIRTITPGCAIKQADGKWLVTDKAKIIFE